MFLEEEENITLEDILNRNEIQEDIFRQLRYNLDELPRIQEM